MQPNTGVSVKTLPLPLRQAAEELLGRSIEDDEMLGIFTFRSPEPVQELSLEEWEREMNEIIDSFPQSPFFPMRPSAGNPSTLAKTRCCRWCSSIRMSSFAFFSASE